MPPAPSRVPGAIKGKQSPQTASASPQPPGAHTEAAQATLYLHSRPLQQQLPLRRPRRPERSSVLDFLRLKYSVSFPKEAMAPACVPGRRSRRTLMHATSRLFSLPRGLWQPTGPGRECCDPGTEQGRKSTARNYLLEIHRALHGDPSHLEGGKLCLPEPTAGAGLHESGWHPRA